APAGAAEAPGEAAGAAGDTADYGAGQSDASGEAEAVECSVEASHGGGRSEDRPAGDGSADASGAEGAGRPSLLRWSPAEGSAASAAGPTLAADRSSFRLVSARRLYDAGTLVQHSPSLAALAAPLPVRLHPSELARLGVEAGSEVRVSSRQGSVVLETVGDVGVPQGTAAITFNQPGPGAADLIDADATVTDVRIETLPGEGDPRG
ncbi:MAG: hypothetical protein M3R01_09900, partial [Actinomycetota bacterium]|nr:hypothetical protein [Actinomycetota bacterium]